MPGETARPTLLPRLSGEELIAELRRLYPGYRSSTSGA
jgi:hypothetical protein